MKQSYLLSFISAVLLSTVFTSCSHEAVEPGKKQRDLPVVSVQLAEAAVTTASNQVELVGTLRASDQAEISAKITGSIITLPLELGSKVQKGDLLVEISAGEISAQVQQTKAQLEQAKRNLNREENLLKQNAATRETVKSMRDAVAIAEAAHREAQTMLEYTRITAPFSGIVTRKVANVGDLATPGKPLLIVERESNLQVLTDIPEAMILKINKGDILPVFIPSVNVRVDGVVAEVSPTADPSSRTAPIKLNVAQDKRLRSGQFARVAINVADVQTLAIPQSSLSQKGQLELVFVAAENKAHLRIVRSGKRSDGMVEILSGLEPGEKVIIAGTEPVTDGQPININ